MVKTLPRWMLGGLAALAMNATGPRAGGQAIDPDLEARPQPASAPAIQAMDVGDRKQLFTDRRFLGSFRNMTMTVNPPEKREIVMRPLEGEDGFHFLVMSVLEVGDEYWMYYGTFRTDLPEEVKGYNRHVTRLAISKDGINWERPGLDLIDIGKGKDNNIVMTGAMGIFFIDPKASDGYPYAWVGHMSERPEWDQSRGTVYREGIGHQGAIYLCRSRDGRKWVRHPRPILPFSCDTRNQGLYDPNIDRYVAYLRARPGGAGSRAVARAESATLATAWPFKKSATRPADENGLYAQILEELPIVMQTDDRDPPGTGLYSPNVHVYPYAERVYLAFPENYRVRDDIDSFGRDQRGAKGTVNEGPLDIALAVSRDGVDWFRYRTPYVRLGRMGEIDGGTMYMGVGMIRKGDELWQYSTVSPHTHHGFFKRLAGTDGGIRRLVQRLDGFVSVDVGADGGEVVTPLITFDGDRLQINVDCSAAGEVWVELLDEERRPIPGFTRADAVSVDMNGVAQEVWWKTGPDVSRLAGKPVRVRFDMRSAKLFAFQFVHHDKEAADAQPK